MKRYFFFLSFIFALWAESGKAQWSPDPNVNTAISTATDFQYYPMMVSDGAGGAIIVWEDRRLGGIAHIYAQRINSAGIVQWAADGVVICTAANFQEFPKIAADGSGGAIISWDDDRGSGKDIYAQRINAAGIVQWTPNGVAICTATNSQQYSEIVSDGSGGAIIAWCDDRSGTGTSNIYARRINASGTPLWAANGVAICTAGGTQTGLQMIPEAGGAIITWDDARAGLGDIYAQKINTSGAVQWAANGLAVCTNTYAQDDPVIASDGLGGAIISWGDQRFSAFEIYAQRVSSSGVTSWATNGVAICTAAGQQGSPAIASDGSNGAIISWRDERTGGWIFDIYAQKVNSMGIVQWTLDGVPICTSAGTQDETQVISDATGGAIITWTDFTPGSDIYAQRVNASGVAVWTPNGVAISTAPNSQYQSRIVSDGASGALICWMDIRNTVGSVYEYDMFVQNICAAGALGGPPPAPASGSITGASTVCAGSPETYSVPPVIGALSYNWTLPSGWSGTSTTNTIVVTPGSSDGLIGVSVNRCGTSPTTTMEVVSNDPSALSMSQTSCDPITVNAQTYNTTGIYTQQFMNAAGCDSTLTLNLTILSTASGLNHTDCDEAVLNSQTYTTSGVYTQMFTNAAGCDSTLTINLTINESSFSTLAVNSCEQYTLNAQTYTASGSYVQTLTNAVGCDSTVTINLTIAGPTSSTLVASNCGEYTLNAQTYETSGMYTQVLANAAGCDSTLTIDLTIENPTGSSLTVTSCNDYTLNAQTYSASGVYTQTLTNVAGCDSTITIDLTIVNPTSSSLTVASCNDYTLNAQTYSASGVYTQMLTNVAGCDSTITIDLTIVNPTSSSLTVTSCNDYTLNAETYAASGVYTQILSNMAGCDSTITIDLTIVDSTSSSLTVISCNDYTLNAQTYTASGVYTQILTNMAGCDSLLTLNLTINSNVNSSQSYTLCSGDSVSVGSNTYGATGTYIDHLSAFNGCDSVVTTDLTISNTIDISTSVSGATITANQAGASYQWLDCDESFSPISGETNQSYTATANGNYSVVISLNACIDTTDCVSVLSAGLTQRPDPGLNVIVSPNPTDGTFIVSSQIVADLIVVTNLLGEKIFEVKPGVLSVEFSSARLKKGIYFVRVINGLSSTTTRLVKN